MILRVDAKHGVLEMAAHGYTDSTIRFPNPRTELTEKQMHEIQGWLGKGTLLKSTDRHAVSHLIASLQIVPDTVEWLAAPLKGSDGSGGIALFLPQEGVLFHEKHVRVLENLLEPLLVAWGNDDRFHEMLVLREAAETENKALLHRLGRNELGDTFIGAETTLCTVMERIDRLAPSDVPVLILGETGTGKELVAREIHRRSGRASGPVIRVNCGAIPPELIDSQLFGHERGSFSGAVEAHRGWFERADRGTLFLDEIGELPLPAQVRLLRVLQDGWLERIGSKKAIRVDVRIVAATHRDLATMVNQGSFREDLWYRIAVFPIRLPPLRERTADLPELARYFAERSAVRFGLPLQLPTPEDIALLASYHWPGNIRELSSVIDRAALLGNGERLEIAKALGFFDVGTAFVPTQAMVPPADPPVQTGEIPTLDEAMRRHIERALSHCRGRIEGARGAAQLLGINPHTLRARMRKLGIVWRNFREGGEEKSRPLEADGEA
jgi:transcriptional regulator with GAF, ATPase, and Fis domain